MDNQPSKESPVTLLQKPRSIKGFFGIFDVLGFKSFCQNNSDQRVAEDVIAAIDLIPENMKGILYSAFPNPDGSKSAMHELLSPISWLVFSDTIVIALPHAENDRRDPAIVFLFACAIFNRLMFSRGLPVRGAILYGDFLLGNRCVAGKVVVEALEQVQELEAACTVISNDAWVRLNELLQKDVIRNPPKMDISSLVLYMLPRSSIVCKSGVKILTALNWFNVWIGGMGQLRVENYDKFVMDNFLAHGKQLDTNAFNKAKNTAALFTTWASQKPASLAEKDSTKPVVAESASTVPPLH